MMRRYLTLLPLLWACSEQPPAGGAAAAAPEGQAAVGPATHPFGFEVWRADFPFEPHLSPAEDRWYGHSRRQALERIVDKLQGNCTRDGWLMAMAFFERAGEEAVPVLAEALDRALQTSSMADKVENIAEALGRMGHLDSDDVAEAVFRAAQHRKESVQKKAMIAMVPAGNAEVVRRMLPALGALQTRSQVALLQAARAHLPEAEVRALFRGLLVRESPHFSMAVDETLKMPPPQAMDLLEPLWAMARGELQWSIAGVMHAVGDARGTHYLRSQLRSDLKNAQIAAIGALSKYGLEPLFDDVLKLSISPDPQVRQAVMVAVSGIDEENVSNLLSTFAVDPVIDVRQMALHALVQRGERTFVEQLIDTMRTATGTNLMSTMADLAASGDEEGLIAIVSRMENAAPEERRPYIKAIARSTAPSAFDALRSVFMEPEAPIAGGTTNVAYAATVMPNQRAAGDRMLELFDALPAEDYRRRAFALHAIANLAAVSAKDPEFAAEVYRRCRALLADREAIPQLRLLALEYLRRDLTLDDMVAIKQQQETEDPPMRKALSSFLFEFF